MAKLYVHDLSKLDLILAALGCAPAATEVPHQAGRDSAAHQKHGMIFDAALHIQTMVSEFLSVACKKPRDAIFHLRRCGAPPSLLKRLQQLNSAFSHVKHMTIVDYQSLCRDV